MAPQPPLLLVENVFNIRRQYPGAVLSASSELVGREAFRVADGRRDRSAWQPTIAGDRPNLDLTGNTPGGTNQRILIGTPGGFNQASTSHTFAFLVFSTAALTNAQILSQVAATTNLLICYRSVGGATPRLGFYDGTVKDFGAGADAPTNAVWHTIVFVFDGGTSLAKVYVDGVQVGTVGGIAYTPRALNPASGAWSFAGHTTLFDQAFSGRLGRAFYYAGAQNAGAVAAIHTTLITGSRDPADPVISTATHLWDPFFGQNAQQLTDIGVSPTAHLSLGRTSSVEASPLYDPYWAGGAWVGVDLGASVTLAPDFLWIDRGHNLWGGMLAVDGSLDPTFATLLGTDRAVPARQIPNLNASGTFVPGGDPTTGVCVTEEGALWMLFTAPLASRAWRVRFVMGSASFTPTVTGIMLGKRHQLLNFSTRFDEDAGARTEVTDESEAGYRAVGRTFSYRTIEIAQRLVGVAEYDTTFRALRTLLFEKNQPFFVALEYGTCPQRGWLYQWDGATWGMSKSTVYREGTLRGREVGPLVR
jgi:hypothetical protein